VADLETLHFFTNQMNLMERRHRSNDGCEVGIGFNLIREG